MQLDAKEGKMTSSLAEGTASTYYLFTASSGLVAKSRLCVFYFLQNELVNEVR